MWVGVRYTMHEWIMMACDLYNSRLTSVLQLCSTLSDDDQRGHHYGSHVIKVQLLLNALLKIDLVYSQFLSLRAFALNISKIVQELQDRLATETTKTQLQVTMY